MTDLKKRIKELENKIDKLESLVYSLLAQLHEDTDDDLIDSLDIPVETPIFIENIFKDKFNEE